MNAMRTDEQVSKERLSDYLNELALNPRAVADYRRDPQSALAASPLTAVERSVLLSADEGRVYHTVNGSLGGNPVAPACVVVVVIKNRGFNHEGEHA